MGANEKHAATYHGGEYTPTTAVVHSIYMTAWNSTVDPVDQQEVQDKARDEFTRWLETVRAEAKAEAWDECDDMWDAAHSLNHIEPWDHLKDNPYK